ncbi:MAG: fibrobacter succinogenes major paralogous domain-containing protein [Fibromonadales bacterium]|nr:fibrobacter succinogenes major paralogous domain-containing protein [Fibromonadales bacterium]
MNTIKSFIFTAILIATAITISCSGDDGGDGGDNDLSSSGVETSSSSSAGTGDGSSSSGSGSRSPCPDYSPGSPLNNGTFTDPRDSQEYSTILICNQTWMAENLNYDASGSRCYDDNTGGDSQGNCDTYGRLYDWDTAMNNAASSSAVPSGVRGVCPEGWHLPSDADWTVLTNYVESNSGCTSCAGKHLKSASGWSSGGNGQDTYGFAALPGGHGGTGGSFYEVGDYGSWWSATEYDARKAWNQSMGYDREYVRWLSSYSYFLFSVRCLQD